MVEIGQKASQLVRNLCRARKEKLSHSTWSQKWFQRTIMPLGPRVVDISHQGTLTLDPIKD